MVAPAPIYRGQGNAAFRSEERTRTLKRGQTVPYDVNGSPTGVGITTNPLTIAASGGAAPGSTFNGAAARTIDYSTVGAAPLSHTHGFADVTGIPTSSLIYRKSAGTGPAETNTLATLKTDLGLTGTNSGDQFTNMTATRLLGRYSAGFGVAQEIILGTNLSFDTGTGTLNAAGLTDGDKGDVVVSGSGAGLTVESASPAGASFPITKPASINQGSQVHVPYLTVTNLGIGTSGLSLTMADGATFTGSRGATGPWVETTIHSGRQWVVNNNAVDATAHAFEFANQTTLARHVAALKHVTAASTGDFLRGLDSADAVKFRIKSTGAMEVPDEVYGAGWNGSGEVPTKNAVYDKFESLPSGAASAVDAQVDFGTGGLTDYAEVTVPAAWVAAGTNIVASPLVPTTADHDPEDALIEGLSAAIQSIIPGVSFVLGVHAPCGTWGRYDFACIGV